MNRTKIIFVVSLLALSISLSPAFTQGNGLASDNIRAILLQDDFSDSPVDGLPFGWVEIKRQDGVIRVVSDDELPSGQALEVLSHAVDGKASQVRLEKHFDFGAQSATIIAIDFKLKWISGVFNGYIRDVVNEEYIVDWAWGIDDNQFRVRNKDVAQLNQGEWNDIRIVADRSTGKANVYVNDMTDPVGTDIDFRSATDSWDNMVFRLATSPKDTVHQSYFGDVLISVID